MKSATAAVLHSVSPEEFQGWSKLEPNEQSKLVVETRALEKAETAYEMSTLEVGEHLDSISKILTPKRQFNKWLMWWLETRKNAKSRSWAYQTMAEYQAIKTEIPKPVMDMAKKIGAKITPQAIVKNPPPQTEDKGIIKKYLENLTVMRVEVVKGPDILLKECVNFVGTRWAQLPTHQKTRAAFMRSLIGMLLSKFGVANGQMFEPMAIPDSFRAARGRPTSKAA